MLNLRPKFLFAIYTILITLIWCVTLPWLANRPLVKQRLDFLESQHIDPSAMFYTELEIMEPILRRIEATRGNSKGD